MKKTRNLMIRECMRTHDIRLWEVADLLGVSESTVVKRFRHELPEEEQKRIIELIKENAGADNDSMEA